MKFSVGSLISDRYELVERLRSGGMGSVFKAWDFQEDSYVVVKIATHNSEYSSLVEYLKREAMALKRLNDHHPDNPRIVRLLNAGDIGESYFVVMEYIHGMDLRSHLNKTGPLPLDICVSVGVDMLEGLGAIHEEGLVHRDLKPENLMATRVGVKIIDFGLVRFISASDRQMKRLTNPGITVGTPLYISPEQALGRSDLDGRCDLYVCGVVLYELLTGVLPFPKFKEGERYWNLPLRPFSEASPPVDIPDKVQAIVWKALQVDPDLRYQTAEEMRMALLAVLDHYSKIIVP